MGKKTLFSAYCGDQIVCTRVNRRRSGCAVAAVPFGAPSASNPRRDGKIDPGCSRRDRGSCTGNPQEENGGLDKTVSRF